MNLKGKEIVMRLHALGALLGSVKKSGVIRRTGASLQCRGANHTAQLCNRAE